MDIAKIKGWFRHRASRAAVALVAAGALIGGVAWREMATPSAAVMSEQTAAAPGIPVAPAIAGQRGSYADIVDAVAPAVVTIRVESPARVSPTGFGDDDFFRRFFGDQF